MLLTALRNHAYQSHYKRFKKACVFDCTNYSLKLQLIKEGAYLTILILFHTRYLLLYVLTTWALAHT